MDGVSNDGALIDGIMHDRIVAGGPVRLLVSEGFFSEAN